MNDRGPNFIGIGVPKSGSTWFMRTLNQHPQIKVTERKEPHFFSNEELYQKGIDNYLKLYKKIEEDKIAGEFSTKYLRSAEKVSPRIKKYFPNTKLICILRNPIERSKSHLIWQKQLGSINKNASLKEALETHKGIVEFSKYSNGIKTFLKDFSKENLLILKTENLRNQPDKIFSKVIDFLNIESFIFDFKSSSKSETITPKFELLEKFRKFAHKKIIEFDQDWILNTSLANNFSKSYRKFNSDKKNNSFQFNDLEEKYLANIFNKDLEELNKITNLDYTDWINS